MVASGEGWWPGGSDERKEVDLAAEKLPIVANAHANYVGCRVVGERGLILVDSRQC